MKTKIIIYFLVLILFSCNSINTRDSDQSGYTGMEVSELNTLLAQGWNTWNTYSVLSHVLLPEAFSINLKLRDGKSGEILEEALIGRESYGSKEHVIPGPHTYDGAYTELEVNWQNIHIRVQSAEYEGDLYLIISPVRVTEKDTLIIEPLMLWDREGAITIDSTGITAQTPGRKLSIFVNGDKWYSTEQNVKISLDKPVVISSGSKKSLQEAESIINKAKAKAEELKYMYPKTPELYNAMQRVLAWNVIYEPTHDRVITPIARTWNVGWKGWILFEWDTYFAAYMFSLDNKELAYANTIAMTNEITATGFVPNFGSSVCTSEDRSQPPVGSFVVKEIYKKYQEKWFLQEVFDELLTWNRWWPENRDQDGYLCWGSDPYEHGVIPEWLRKGIGAKKGAQWESGLDNSPMWDDAVYDTTLHMLRQADVGLMSLYIADCRSLAEIAGVLGKSEIEHELTERAEKYSKSLQTLWNDEFGLFLNKDLTKNEFSYRLSPTLFYPLLAEVPDQKQAERMIENHFYNPEEFWGEFIMPAIARNDPAYKDNIYWRGRIWAPMNFLVYLGMRNYDLPGAKKDLVEKSENLLLKSWLAEHHIYENYSAETGQGDDAGMSDKFYHWGALLGFIGIIEEGYVPSPQLSLVKE